MRRVFVLLIPLTLAAQTSTRIRPRSPEIQAPALKPEDLCSVDGQVVNALTGEPLRKATVTLRLPYPITVVLSK